ncbi:hypothetical protein SAMN05421823_106117 [Catalinimonas alkaloidigena]|uniref:Uncharacterized protein n=1 Tax=Catalinimonas alkaloidigena TaxID=1075417 RepID=A0A1G9KBD7_9BACT|nr:hypothetical protein [Catalinimonas alkaloidigena]SDL47250.1 hypothetical protein SAMN05421823_106117 [Catalinimonas alkaloidigena]
MNLRLSLLLMVLLVGSASVSAQAVTVTDSITVKPGPGTVFMYQGNRLKPKQLLLLTQRSPAAYQEMQIAKSKSDVASVLGFIGGGLVGWPIGTALGGGQPNWALAGVGAGIIAVSIPFTASYNKHARAAAALYNQNAVPTATGRLEMELRFSGQHLGMQLRF